MRASGFSHIVILTLLLLISSIVFSQVTTGTPPFRSFSGGPDVINLGNFNVHYSIPIFSRPGRGTPFTYALSYDSSVWTIVSSTWAPVSSTWGLNRELGARVGTVTVKSIPIRGCDGAGATGYTFSKYVDSAGTTHKFFAAVNDDPDCVGTWTATRVLDDGSGITITVDATPSATVTLKNGDVIKPILSSGTNSGSGTSTDYNGNKITSTVVGTTTTFYDTLSTSVPALIIDASNPNSVKYKYAAPGDTNPSSPGVKVTAGYVNKNVKTAFGCSGIGEYGGASGIPTALLDTITLADGSFYKFAYEPTTKDATTVTGRIASVTLPTGGQITYTYTGGSHGIMCADGSTAGFDRTTPDTGSAHWSFLRASSPTTTTKVTDPTGNDTVATFNGEFETARDVYQGPSSGSVLEHITTCYNGTSASPCGGTVTTPFSQVTVERQFNGGSQSRVDTMYDGYGSVTELDEFDFGTSSPTRQTTTVYASLGNNIVDRPASVTVKDGSGTQKAKTAYGYDEYTLQGTGTLPNHGSVTGARGNLTTIKQYSSATAFLTRTLKYYDTGLMYTSADVNPTAVTTYTYGYCAGAFPSSISLPLGLSRSMIWNCNGSVVTSSTDENSKATTYTYDDPYFWRPHTIGRPDGGQTTFTYHTGSFPLVGTWSIDSSSKIDAAANYLTETTNFDTLGRVAHANLTSAPEGTITTDIAFDSSGRVASRSNAHLSTPSPTDGTTSYEYDALNRVTTVTRPNGSTVQTSYNIGAAEIQDEGNGTSSIAKILQSDGLGRLKSVCEVTSAPQLGISANPAPCNQDISATGFLTSYNYDTLDNITQVTQGGLNPRQYAYDQMSRLTSSTTPEAGITTYTYDHTGQLGDLYTRLKPKANQTNASVKTTTTYTHDLLHRLTAVTYDDGSSNATYGYDESSVSSVTVTNGKGRLTHMSGRDSTEVYSYDAVGRRNGGTQCAPISCGGTWWPLTYTYNYLGGVTSFTNGYESRTYSYTYDNAGRLTKMTSSLNDSTHPGTLLTVNTYNPLGEITKETLGNGIVRTLGYDNGGRVTSVTDGSLYSFTLGYAPNGDVLTGNDSINGNWTYTYDGFNRIATSAKTGNAFAYQYDRFGNRWQQNVTAGTGPAPSYLMYRKNKN